MSEYIPPSDPRIPIPPAPPRVGRGWLVIVAFVVGAVLFAFLFRGCATGPDEVFGRDTLVVDSAVAPKP